MLLAPLPLRRFPCGHWPPQVSHGCCRCSHLACLSICRWLRPDRSSPTTRTCPLLLFNREGDCLAAKLRPGNVHSAEQWDQVLLPEIERQQQEGKDVVVRVDAAFAKPELYEALEKRGVRYAIRIPANDSLERAIAELLTRPVGRTANSGCTS